MFRIIPELILSAQESQLAPRRKYYTIVISLDQVLIGIG